MLNFRHLEGEGIIIKEIFPKVDGMLGQILDGLEEAIHIVSVEGKTVVYNRAAAVLDELTREEVLGAHVLDVFPSLTERTSTLLKVLETGRPVHAQQQTYMNRKGKHIVTVNKTFPLLEDGKLIGAVEVAKDITSVKELSDQVLDLREQMSRPRGRAEPSRTHTYQFTDIITQCPVMQKEIARAKRASKTLSPVLVVGETGTGKELIVQSIHHNSPRRDKPFVAQNCAAIPSALLEGILFGTVKGAFTGAEDRKGLFELAHGGTLFLDEIQATPIDLQAKLLRALEEGLIRRVGGVKLHPVDVRIIVATNEDPLESISAGRLRKDLFYRIHVMRIQLPPLNERKGDIPLLTGHFLKQLQEQYPHPIPAMGKEVANIFDRYDWPGNVRELKHTLEGAINIADGAELIPEDLPAHIRGAQRKACAVPFDESMRLDLKEYLQEIEQEIIMQVLNVSGDNVMKASRLLGIPRQTLQYKLRKIRDGQ